MQFLCFYPLISKTMAAKKSHSANLNDHVTCSSRNWGSVFISVTMLHTGKKGFECQGQAIFPSPKCPHWLCPHSLLYNVYWGSFSCRKMAGALGKSLCPHNSEVKNKWSNTSAPPICLHGMDRDKSTFSHAAANCVNAHTQG